MLPQEAGEGKPQIQISYLPKTLKNPTTIAFLTPKVKCLLTHPHRHLQTQGISSLTLLFKTPSISL